MENIFVEFLPPWVETGLQPAFYDKESGTVLQQTARMYARVNMLIRMFNKLSKNTKTTVENYINQFNELHDYVHDYFDNLDVQEEINNKLDAMVEAGTLQEIITTYIQSNVAWAFDTVSDMQLATNLVDGSFAQTLGYRAKGDGGSAIYKITSSEPATYYETLGDSLYAELVDTGYIVPEMFGAYGDGAHDDTDAIQTAIDFCNDIVFNKTYKITKVSLHSNTHLYGNGTIIGTTQGRMIDLVGTISTPLTNIHIENLTFKHENVTFTQNARILEIRYSQKVVINNCLFTHWTGDAICISNFQTTSHITKDIEIYDNRFENEHTGRQAITILSGSNISIKNNKFIDTSAASMPGAIDIEPWYDEEFGDLLNYEFENILIDSNYCSNSVYDTSFVVTAIAKTQGVKNYVISNNTVYNTNSASGIKLLTDAHNSETVRTREVKIINNNIHANFINILVSNFESIICNNTLINGLLSFGGAYLTSDQRQPITKLNFFKNIYDSDSDNVNTEYYIMDINQNTDSLIKISDNTFNFNSTASNNYQVYCIKNSLYSGMSQPTISAKYFNNIFNYKFTAQYAYFVSNNYGEFSGNSIFDIGGALSTYRLFSNVTDTFSSVNSNIHSLSTSQSYTASNTSLSFIKQFTIPKNTAFSFAVYMNKNESNIDILEIRKGGTVVADSGPSTSRERQSASYSGFTGNSSITINIYGAYSAAGTNTLNIDGYYVTPIYLTQNN